MNKEILRLAIPNILSNISIPLLSTVDTALMGRLSELHVGAVGLGSMLFNFLYWNFGFLRMGTTGMAAQAYGREDKPGMIHILVRAFLVGLALSVLIILIQFPFAEAGFYALNVDASQLDLVAEYFYIRIYAAPATLILMVLFGWFFGMQNAVYPLILTMVINVINIIANFFFVHQMGMTVDGVAWGTVIAQYSGLLLGVVLFYYKYGEYVHFIKRDIVLNLESLKQFFTINRDIFIRTVCLTVTFSFFYSQSSKAGVQILAANVILLQLLNWMSYGIDGFAFASESLIGKYHGAGNPNKFKEAIQKSLKWGLGVAIFYSLLYGIFQDPIINVYTDQVAIIATTKEYMIWMIIMPVLGFGCYIWDGIFIGMTASKAMRNSMFISIVIFLISYYPAYHYFGNHGLWLSLGIFLFARGIIQWRMYRIKGIALQ